MWFLRTPDHCNNGAAVHYKPIILNWKSTGSWSFSQFTIKTTLFFISLYMYTAVMLINNFYSWLWQKPIQGNNGKNQ